MIVRLARVFARRTRSLRRQFSQVAADGFDDEAEKPVEPPAFVFHDRTVAIPVDLPVFSYKVFSVVVDPRKVRLLQSFDQSKPIFVTAIVTAPDDRPLCAKTEDFVRVGTYCQVEAVKDRFLSLRALQRLRVARVFAARYPASPAELEGSELAGMVGDAEVAAGRVEADEDAAAPVPRSFINESARAPGDEVLLAENEPLQPIGYADLSLEDRVKIDVVFDLNRNFSKSLAPEHLSYQISYTDTEYFLNNVGNNLEATRIFSKEEIVRLYVEEDVSRAIDLTLAYIQRAMGFFKRMGEVGKLVDDSLRKRQVTEYYAELQRMVRKLVRSEGADPVDLLAAEFRAKKAPQHVRDVFEESLKRLQAMERNQAEYSVLKSYLGWIAALPFGVRTPEDFDIDAAERALEESHYGMREPKQRVIEYLAVGKIKGTLRGKIMCLEGPPGVGKTSFAFAIAKAINRKVVRISLGGENDVSTLKGHRRTYVGSFPGKVVSALKECQAENCVIVIDEVDKLARNNMFGDPQNTLLEILDPEQNNAFTDSYLDFPIDLSNVFFICTANDLSRVSAPLLDRMDVIYLPSYSTAEKVQIFHRHLLPRTVEEAGLAAHRERFALAEDVVLPLINDYCREAGIRSLERHTARIMEKIAFKIVAGLGGEAEADAETPATREEAKEEDGPVVVDSVVREMLAAEDLLGSSAETGPVDDSIAEAEWLEASGASSAKPSDSAETADAAEEDALDAEMRSEAREATPHIRVSAANLESFLGPPVFGGDDMYTESQPGVVKGLAYNTIGGAVLFIESNVAGFDKPVQGLKMTGMLGEVMKESMNIAYSYMRAFLHERGNPFLEQNTVHIHVPEGATPKDGPSAGLAIATALSSLATRTPFPNNVAMTGELSLKGHALRIGGLKEKLLAAKREGVTRVLLPADNSEAVEEIEKELVAGLEVVYIDNFSKLFDMYFSSN